MRQPIFTLLERHFEEAFACLCFSIVAVCVMLQVILRYVFNTGLIWTEELSSFAMVWGVYMGASLAIRERYHVRILVGVVALPRLIGLPLILVGDFLLLVFCIFMMFIGAEYLTMLWQHPTISPALNINQFWPHSIVVIAYLLIALRVMQIYVGWFREGRLDLPGMPTEFQSTATDSLHSKAEAHKKDALSHE